MQRVVAPERDDPDETLLLPEASSVAVAPNPPGAVVELAVQDNRLHALSDANLGTVPRPADALEAHGFRHSSRLQIAVRAPRRNQRDGAAWRAGLARSSPRGSLLPTADFA